MERIMAVGDRFTKWMATILLAISASDARALLSLNHSESNDSLRLVRTFTVDSSISEEPMIALVNEIQEEARGDADQLGGMQRYLVQATTTSGRELGSIALRYHGDLPFGLTGIDSEPPNQRGILTQMMRHGEANARVMVEGFQVASASMQRQLIARDQAFETLTEKTFELMETFHKVNLQKTELEVQAEDRRAERELERIRAIHGEERRQALFKTALDKLPLLLSLVVAHATGKSAAPSEKAAIDWFRSLGGEDRERIRALIGSGAYETLMQAAGSAPAAPVGPLHAPDGAGTGGTVPAPPAAPLPGDKVLTAIFAISASVLPAVNAALAAGKAPNLADLDRDGVNLLRRLMATLGPDGFDELALADAILSQDERKALQAVVKALDLRPSGTETIIVKNDLPEGGSK